MNIEEVINSPQKKPVESWQLGSVVQNNIQKGGVVLIFCADYRGCNVEFKPKNTQDFRDEFYKLSKSDWELPIIDLGDVCLGKTIADTRFLVQEISNFCLDKSCIPIFIGGGMDLAEPQLKSISFLEKKIEWSHIGAKINLTHSGDELNAGNLFFQVFTDKKICVNHFNLIGYQQHLNNPEFLKALQNVDFEVFNLGNVVKNTDLAEPFFRRSHFASIDCNALESSKEKLSIQPQINGLNNREICSVAKDIGMSENLKSVGIYNFSFEGQQNFQLLAQMIWYLVEGINIRKSHPKEKNIETFLVLIAEYEFTFKREIFTNLWYFGECENLNNCIPCSKQDFENAKKGILNQRLAK